MERCGSDCPAMKGGAAAAAATAGGERNTAAASRSCCCRRLVDWWWWAASELPGCLPGRAPGPDPRTRGWMLAYLGRQPSTSPKRKESPSTTRRREKGRRAGQRAADGSAAGSRLLLLVAAGSGRVSITVPFGRSSRRRCWPPGAPLRASTRATAFLRRRMTPRSASAACATSAGRRSPAASPASPTSTPTRPAPSASMWPSELPPSS